MKPRILRLAVLGRFEARWSDGQSVELPGKKTQALLGYLAVEGRPKSREFLASLLWSETGEDRARHNLRQAVSKLRAAPAAVIVSDEDTLALDPEACSTDVRDFELAASATDPADLERCLRLYRGELLDGLVVREPMFEEWLLASRNRLGGQASRVAERLAATLLEHGRTSEAIEALHRRLAMDPACEPAHRSLMQALSQTGRRTDALRQYQQCARILERELGTRPSSETTVLYERIRDGSPPDGQEGAAQTVDGVAFPAGGEKPSVAVLRFSNLSTDQDDYFVDGIAEDIITALSRFGSLTVIARSSSFAARDVPTQQIGRDLGAKFLVCGSVRRGGQRLRVNVQLLDSQTGSHIWAQSFDREIEDVLLVQDEVASTIVSTLAGRVEAAHTAKARRLPPERMDAYDLVLRGKELHHRFTPEDCRLALQMFERAMERDSEFALAPAWLACGLGQAIVFEPEKKESLLDRSQALAERGLELDQNESECHRILAQIHLMRRDVKRALWHQEKALFLNPNDDRSVCAMGEILSYAGRPQEAELWVRRAMRLNPYHPARYWLHLARALFHTARYGEALDALDRVSPEREDDLAYRVAVSAKLGETGDVQRRVRALRTASPMFAVAAFVSSLPYDDERHRKEIREALASAGL